MPVPVPVPVVGWMCRGAGGVKLKPVPDPVQAVGARVSELKLVPVLMRAESGVGWLWRGACVEGLPLVPVPVVGWM